MDLLIPYDFRSGRRGHEDPMFSEFTYGDGGARGRRLKRDLVKGDYVFFHGMCQGKKCISAYYVVDRVMSTREAARLRPIMAKFRNPHLERCASGARITHPVSRRREVPKKGGNWQVGTKARVVPLDG